MPSKIVLITGGTKGIGRTIALHLAAQGQRVFVASRRPPTEPMPDVTYVPLDLHSEAAIQDCVRTVLAQAGRIDVLVNNAGYIGPIGASEEVGLEEARALFETNFFGAVQMINMVLPSMRERRAGLIINISSITGRLTAIPFASFYDASKHALEGYSKALVNELRPLGIEVAIIEPGSFASDIRASLKPPAHPLDDFAIQRDHAMVTGDFYLRHGHDPQPIAHLVSQLIDTGPRRLHYPVGLEANLLNVFCKLLPDLWYQKLTHWMFLGSKPLEIGTDDETVSRRLGIRRYMAENPLVDNWRQILGGLVILAGIAGVLIVRRRAPRRSQ